MNDPHVMAIHYYIEHDDSVDYHNVAPLVFEDDLFYVSANKVEVVFEPKGHYETEEQARNAVEDLIRRWEFEAALRARSSEFRLLYGRVDVIDRNPPAPPPEVVNLGPVTILAGVPRVRARLTKVLAEFPAPPSGQDIEPNDPDALFMLSRLDLYRQRRESLANLANLCLTVLESSASQAIAGKDGKRSTAAKHYRISMPVLNRAAELSAKKGGHLARKAEGRNKPFKEEETLFLEAATVAFVRRAAEKAANPNGNLPMITMTDLPKLWQ